jgi:hypothetical protein
MADKVFIGTGSSIDLSTAGNYSPSGVPANGDRLFFINGLSTDKITAGLATLAAVTLALVRVYDTYSGQFGTDALSGGDVQMGYDVMQFGYPSGTRSAGSGGGPTRAKIKTNAIGGVTIVHSTGTSADAALGGEALRWTGTHATANKIYVMAGSVGIGTQDLTAAVVTDLDVQGGTVNVGVNATPRNMTQSGGTFRHNGLTHASGSIKQTAGTLYTTGATLIPTIHVGGRAYINHRVSAGICTDTLLVRGTGEADLTDDPRDFQITDPLLVQKGGKLYFARPGQLTGAGWQSDGCDINEVTVKAGGSAVVTMTAV